MIVVKSCWWYFDMHEQLELVWLWSGKFSSVLMNENTCEGKCDACLTFWWYIYYIYIYLCCVLFIYFQIGDRTDHSVIQMQCMYIVIANLHVGVHNLPCRVVLPCSLSQSPMQSCRSLQPLSISANVSKVVQ